MPPDEARRGARAPTGHLALVAVVVLGILTLIGLDFSTQYLDGMDSHESSDN